MPASTTPRTGPTETSIPSRFKKPRLLEQAALPVSPAFDSHLFKVALFGMSGGTFGTARKGTPVRSSINDSRGVPTPDELT